MSALALQEVPGSILGVVISHVPPAWIAVSRCAVTSKQMRGLVLQELLTQDGMLAMLTGFSVGAYSNQRLPP